MRPEESQYFEKDSPKTMKVIERKKKSKQPQQLKINWLKSTEL